MKNAHQTIRARADAPRGVSAADGVPDELRPIIIRD